MGFRTVVIISNDRAHEITDPVLKDAVYDAWSKKDHHFEGPYRIVEQVHADTATLMKISTLGAEPLAHGNWSEPDLELTLLKRAADKLGYSLTKKRPPKRINDHGSHS